MWDFSLIVTPKLNMRCIRLSIQPVLIALGYLFLVQSLTVNQSLVVPNGLSSTSPPLSTTTPPPCTIQTQVCTSSSPPHWVPDPIQTHPDNYSKQNCSISFMNGAGLWEFPVITQPPGRYGVPCADGTFMTFRTRIGTAFIVYEGTLDGIPDYPLIGYVSKVRVD